MDRNTREGVAVKVLDAGFGADPATVDRILREQHILTAFLHPTFVRVRDVVTGEGTLALVTEFVQGWDLGPPPGPHRSVGDRDGRTDRNDPGRCTGRRARRRRRPLRPQAVQRAARGAGRRGTPDRLPGGPAGPRLPRFGRLVHQSRVRRSGGHPRRRRRARHRRVRARHHPVRDAARHHAVPVGRPGEVIAGHIRAEPWLPATVPDPLRRLVEDCLEGEPAARPSALAVARRLRQLDVSGVPEPIREPPEVLPAMAPRGPAGGRRAAGQQMPVEPVAAPPPGRPRPAPRRPRSGGLTGVRGALLAGGLALIVAVAVLGLRLLSPASGNATAGRRPGLDRRRPAGHPPDHPPQPPASAEPATAEGGSAFVRHWFEALNYAIGTGDTSALDASSSPSCRACADLDRVRADRLRRRRQPARRRIHPAQRDDGQLLVAGEPEVRHRLRPLVAVHGDRRRRPGRRAGGRHVP